MEFCAANSRTVRFNCLFFVLMYVYNCNASCVQVQVHKTLVSLGFPEVDLPSLMNGLNETVLCTVLHYIYSHTLPSTVTTATVQLCIEQFESQPELDRFVELCRQFLANSNLRVELQSLVKSIHTSLERMVSLFEINDQMDMPVNAPRLWQSLKLSLGCDLHPHVYSYTQCTSSM